MGKTGLVTVILRHLLEDDCALRTSMEAEIRCTVTRLHKKQRRGTNANAGGKVKVTASSFVQAIAPLICRDPIVFLKAAAISVTTEISSPNGDDGNRSRSNSSIVLLSAEERSKHCKALADYFSSSQNSNSYLSHSHRSHSKSNTGTSGGKRKHASPSNTDANKGSNKSKKKCDKVSPKRSRKEKSEMSGSNSNFFIINGSPANHVTSLLITNLIEYAEKELKPHNENRGIVSEEKPQTFVGLVDLLDILADLILAVPACAAAIHRYRPPGGTVAHKRLSNLRHALSGCASPPSTAVGYLLHYLVPVSRVTPTKDAKKTDDKVLLAKNRHSYLKVQSSQKAARLLIILCARAGEGRRRVVSDLASALGGSTPSKLNEKEKGKSPLSLSQSEREMWALQSWGELCIGLSAPRSGGINFDSDAALSWEVVKLMLEFGVAHALMEGIKRVNLNVPMASNAAGALLRPLEVFTRGTVTDAIEEMARVQAEKEAAEEQKRKEKGEAAPSKKPKSDGLSRRITFGPSQRSEESFAEDAMLEDGFMPEDADRARRRAQRQGLRDMVDDMVELGGYDDDDEDVDDEELEEMLEDDGMLLTLHCNVLCCTVLYVL